MLRSIIQRRACGLTYALPAPQSLTAATSCCHHPLLPTDSTASYRLHCFVQTPLLPTDSTASYKLHFPGGPYETQQSLLVSCSDRSFDLCLRRCAAAGHLHDTAAGCINHLHHKSCVSRLCTREQISEPSELTCLVQIVSAARMCCVIGELRLQVEAFDVDTQQWTEVAPMSAVSFEFWAQFPVLSAHGSQVAAAVTIVRLVCAGKGLTQHAPHRCWS